MAWGVQVSRCQWTHLLEKESWLPGSKEVKLRLTMLPEGCPALALLACRPQQAPTPVSALSICEVEPGILYNPWYIVELLELDAVPQLVDGHTQKEFELPVFDGSSLGKAP